MPEKIKRLCLFSEAALRPLRRAFKVETGKSKDRAAAAAEEYLPSFMALMANEIRPSCSVNFFFLLDRGVGMIIVVNKICYFLE